MTELEATRAKLKCLEMVEGTGLDWWRVIRLAGNECKTPLDFSYPTACYTFALGVVEGNPVWEGDTLYHIRHGKVVIRKNNRTTDYLKMEGYSGVEALASSFSWNPPKPATLMVELPIEDVEFWNNLGEFFCFKNKDAYEIASSRFYKSCKKALEQLK